LAEHGRTLLSGSMSSEVNGAVQYGIASGGIVILSG
jgi:hypothetical protein